jgi:hypothetical protein
MDSLYTPCSYNIHTGISDKVNEKFINQSITRHNLLARNLLYFKFQINDIDRIMRTAANNTKKVFTKGLAEEPGMAPNID